MPLIQTKTIPPGGWIYEQQDDSGKVVLQKFKTFGPFSDAAFEILAFRTGNKLAKATLGDAMNDLDQATCMRLGYDPQWCSAEKKTRVASPSTLPGVLGEVARRAANAVKASATGARILADWLGEGGRPVPTKLASSRAAVCVSCENNKPGIAPFTGSIARAILDQMRVKNMNGITIPNEKQLHTCAVCMCHLPLKVHVPFSLLSEHTPKGHLDRFPAKCWMLTEKTLTT